MEFPVQGRARDELFQVLAAYRQYDVPWRAGRVYTGIYDPGEEVQQVVKQAYTEFLTENGLYPNLFPSLLQLEKEVVQSVANLVRGNEHVVGNATSGGTESIMLAVKAARDKARAERPEIVAPELVLPITAHPAFHKAAHYLGLNVVVTAIDPHTYRADPQAIEAAITPNTVLLAASAPCYSHGTIDPISAIGEIALKHQLPFHVDACVGGIHLSIMRRNGANLPDFDFSVPGVTSLSADMHKYGYAAKNVSVVLYHDRSLRRYALFTNASTTGYAVINTTVLSSKSGGPLAGAWATIQYLGEAGYRTIVDEVMDATKRMIAGIGQFPDLQVLGQPDMCMFAIASDTLNVFALDDEMARRGWVLQPQFSAPGTPANLHVSIHRANVPHVDAFLSDLAASIAAVKASGALDDIATLRDQVLQLMAHPSPSAFAEIAALAGLVPGSLPSGFAKINTVLDVLPNPVVEALLIEYLNNLYG